MITVKLQKCIEKQLIDAVERYHLDRIGLQHYIFGFCCDYPGLSDSDFEQIFEHLTTIKKEDEMICKAILEVTVENDLSVTSRVLGTSNLSTDFKNLYTKLRGIAERDECGKSVLKDLISLGDTLSAEVTS